MHKYTFIAAFLLIAGPVAAQKKSKELPGMWYQENSSKKKFNIDLNKAYATLLKDKQANEIVVAVIDGGTDVSHPDLKENIWHNPGEIPFNNIDDDKNGYVDDTVGWNFIGGPGGNVHHDNLEITRLVRFYQSRFDGLDAEDIDDPAEKALYNSYIDMKAKVTEEYEDNKKTIEILTKVSESANEMLEKIGKPEPTADDVAKYESSDENVLIVKIVYNRVAAESGMSFREFCKTMKEESENSGARSKYHYNVDYDPRSIVGDGYFNSSEKYYGNNDVAGPDAFHGTHVAGIIGAVRGNGVGVEGIASKVKIMVVRVVPDGDERDKDVANGIRYAVDNGAKIINMSFGKGYKFNKSVVDSAVAYAVSKGVLLVHAAGNDADNNDYIPNYPNDSLPGGQFAATWVEVGASQPEPGHLATSFSNYGKANVDLFAPGYRINSTAPDNKYEKADGTSMAAPVVSGVAALVWSHYPSLTAAQVKEILMNSGLPYKKSVILPGTAKDKVNFADLSVSGRVVNAFRALQMAQEIAGK